MESKQYFINSIVIRIYRLEFQNCHIDPPSCSGEQQKKTPIFITNAFQLAALPPFSVSWLCVQPKGKNQYERICF